MRLTDNNMLLANEALPREHIMNASMKSTSCNHKFKEISCQTVDGRDMELRITVECEYCGSTISYRG